MTVIIGIDPHKASHTAVAIGRDERWLPEIRVRADGEAVGLGRTTRRANVGRRIGRRDGLPIVLAVGWGRRACRRCADDPGLEGAGARHRKVRQE